MTHHQTLLWIDHQEAKVFHLEAETFELKHLKAEYHHLTPKAEEQGHHAGHKKFFDEVAVALNESEQIVVVGPSSGKTDFMRHLKDHQHEIAARVLGVETLGNPSDAQVVAFGRRYFVVNDGHPKPLPSRR